MYTVDIAGRLVLNAEQLGILLKLVEESHSLTGWNEESYTISRTNRISINDIDEELVKEIVTSSLSGYNNLGEYRDALNNPPPEGD